MGTKQAAAPEKLYSVSALAHAAGVSERTIRALIASGALRASRVGTVGLRVSPQDWAKYVEASEYRAPSDLRNPNRHGARTGQRRTPTARTKRGA